MGHFLKEKEMMLPLFKYSTHHLLLHVKSQWKPANDNAIDKGKVGCRKSRLLVTNSQTAF